jgi:hypothetical protein
MHAALARLLATSGGVFHLGPRPAVRTVITELAAAGWRVSMINARATSNKQALLAEIADTVGFPEWFGHNWDALADALRDAALARADSGQRGLCLIVNHAGALIASDRPAAETLIDICRELSEESLPLLLVVRSR